MAENIINTVLQITNYEDNDMNRLKINAILNEILSYLNRDEISEDIFPSVAVVIAECIKNSEIGAFNITSLSEGDMSVSYVANSPFFGKLESFKLIRGIK